MTEAGSHSRKFVAEPVSLEGEFNSLQNTPLVETLTRKDGSEGSNEPEPSQPPADAEKELWWVVAHLPTGPKTIYAEPLAWFGAVDAYYDALTSNTQTSDSWENADGNFTIEKHAQRPYTDLEEAVHIKGKLAKLTAAREKRLRARGFTYRKNPDAPPAKRGYPPMVAAWSKERGWPLAAMQRMWDMAVEEIDSSGDHDRPEPGDKSKKAIEFWKEVTRDFQAIMGARERLERDQ